jgi:hypothetical protein
MITTTPGTDRGASFSNGPGGPDFVLQEVRLLGFPHWWDFV